VTPGLARWWRLALFFRRYSRACVFWGASMFEIRLYKAGELLFVETAEQGDLLPKIATLLQLFEAKYGKYEHQRPYSLQWRRVRE
jgi:hypothetical protein